MATRAPRKPSAPRVTPRRTTPRKGKSLAEVEETAKRKAAEEEAAKDTRTLRLIGFVLTPVVVWDDGEEITDGPQCQAQQVRPSQLVEKADEFKAGLKDLEKAHKVNDVLMGAQRPVS